ncbi:hypothetical protein D3C77_425840 [compost metagenome]
MRSCKTNARNINLTDVIHQIGKRIIDVCEIFAVSVHVLPKQSNFLKSLARQITNFGNNILRTAAALLAACKRNDAIRAKFITAVHNVNPSAHAFPLLRQVLDNVSFFGPYFDYHLFAEQRFLDQMRQTMNIMSTKNHIYEPVLLQNTVNDTFFL